MNGEPWPDPQRKAPPLTPDEFMRLLQDDANHAALLYEMDNQRQRTSPALSFIVWLMALATIALVMWWVLA